MTFQATVVQVLIASPSDTSEHRDAIEGCLNRWNISRAVGSSVMLLPRRYETSAVPQMGTDGQSVINNQLVKDADVVIAVFANKLGSATPRALSGTVEEIKEAHEAGKHVHVYFSSAPVPREHLADVAALDAYRAQFEGLYGTFTDTGDLIEQVRHAIDTDISSIAASPLPTKAGGANPVVFPESESAVKHDSKGKPKDVTKRAMVVENKSDVDAEDFLVSFTSTDGGDIDSSGVFMFDEPFQQTLYAGQSVKFRYELTMNSDRTISASMAWTEGGEPKTRDVRVSTY